MYASTDFVSLFTVKKHKTSTLFHHTFSVVMNLMAVFYADFEEESVWKLLMLYGIYSTLSYSVNLFLGVRFLFERSSKVVDVLCIASCGLYIVSCSLNWTSQIYYILSWKLSLFSWQLIFYLTGIFFFIRDDIKLIQFMISYVKHSENKSNTKLRSKQKNG